MAFKKRTFIGKGPIYLEEVDGSTGLIPFGNCSSLEVSFEEDAKSMMNYMEVGGGKYDEIKRVSNMAGSLTGHDLTPENLAIGARGSTTAGTAEAIVDEVHVAHSDGFVPFNKAPNKSITIDVKNNAGDTTYAVDVDYVVGNSGIRILEAGSITDGESIKISYTSLATTEVELLTVEGKTYRLVWDGVNEADSKPCPVELYRIKFSPASAMALLGDDFAELPLEFTVLMDETKSGTGISKYGKFIV